MASGRNERRGRVRYRRRIPVEDHAKILKKFDELSEKHKTAEKAAKKLGVHLSTIYRWKRKYRDKKSFEPLVLKYKQDVNKAIITLLYNEKCAKYEFMKALFVFISWLRWPSEMNDLEAAVTVCVTNYVAQVSKASKISELDPNDRHFLIEHIHIDDLRAMTSPDRNFFPYFDRFNIDDQPFDERDYMANIAWIVLGYRYASVDRNSKPSLHYTHYILQKNLFEYFWEISLRTFREKWRAFGAASLFYFVEEQTKCVKLSVDPKNDCFARDMNEIFEDRMGLFRYLRHCKWAVEQMRAQLDPRAFQNLWLPDFPVELVPLPLRIPPLPNAVITLIAQKSAT